MTRQYAVANVAAVGQPVWQAARLSPSRRRVTVPVRKDSIPSGTTLTCSGAGSCGVGIPGGRFKGSIART